MQELAQSVSIAPSRDAAVRLVRTHRLGTLTHALLLWGTLGAYHGLWLAARQADLAQLDAATPLPAALGIAGRALMAAPIAIVAFALLPIPFGGLLALGLALPILALHAWVALQVRAALLGFFETAVPDFSLPALPTVLLGPLFLQARLNAVSVKRLRSKRNPEAPPVVKFGFEPDGQAELALAMGTLFLVMVLLGAGVRLGANDDQVASLWRVVSGQGCGQDHQADPAQALVHGRQLLHGDAAALDQAYDDLHFVLGAGTPAQQAEAARELAIVVSNQGRSPDGSYDPAALGTAGGWLDQAEGLEPQSETLLRERGVLALLEQHPDQAMKAADALEKLRPGQPEAALLLGLALEATGEKEAAEAVLEPLTEAGTPEGLRKKAAVALKGKPVVLAFEDLTAR